MMLLTAQADYAEAQAAINAALQMVQSVPFAKEKEQQAAIEKLNTELYDLDAEFYE